MTNFGSSYFKNYFNTFLLQTKKILWPLIHEVLCQMMQEIKKKQMVSLLLSSYDGEKVRRNTRNISKWGRKKITYKKQSIRSIKVWLAFSWFSGLFCCCEGRKPGKTPGGAGIWDVSCRLSRGSDKSKLTPRWRNIMNKSTVAKKCKKVEGSMGAESIQDYVILQNATNISQRSQPRWLSWRHHRRFSTGT